MRDAMRKSFIFSLDLKKKYLPQKDEKLIYSHCSYGPIFGGGCDICIADECDKNRNSGGCFPHTYNSEDEKMERNQDSYHLFTGSTKGYNFKV